MSIFDDQIRQRMQNDQQNLEDSFMNMASLVLDRWSMQKLDQGRMISQDSITDILKYHHEKPVDIPEDIMDPYKQLEIAFRPSGLMMRPVDLDEGWQKDAYGIMLGYFKESGRAVTLVPGAVSGYYFKDPNTGKKIRVNKKTAGLLSKEALCFYRPLPRKKLGISDLLLYLKNSISRGDIALIVLATLAVVLVGMIEPRVYSLLTGTVLRLKQIHLLVGVGSFLLASAFASILLNLAKSLLIERINTKTSQAVSASVMLRILYLPVSFFRKYSSGELLSRVSSVNSLCTMIIQNTLSLGLGGLLSLLYITQIFRFAPALVIPAILTIVATLAVSTAASFMQISISRNQMKLAAKESGMNYSILSGIQKIKLTGTEKRMFARWGNLYAQSARLNYNPPMFLKINGVIVQAIGLASTVVLYAIAIHSSMDVSQYYAFNAAYGRMMGAFTALAGIAVSIAQIRPILEMAEPILKAEPEVNGERTAVSNLTGKIEMNHVSFRYDENTPYIFKDLSLNIKPGEYVAIVGRTGCGKSTLVRLLLGFEQPEKGSVFYDHFDLNHSDPVSVRKQIGVVTQNGQLLAGDIYSNITISAPFLTMDEAWEAAQTAGIAEDIRKMPMGMHTMISEGQGGISGGQKQRIMIARAIAPKPKILIFDEATSALDNKTQKQISEALDKMNCTRIVIAHRLSTIQHCDRILMLQNGEIIEEGTYDELIQLRGEFADMVERQRLS